MVMKSYYPGFLAKRGTHLIKSIDFTIKHSMNLKTGSKKANRVQLPK